LLQPQMSGPFIIIIGQEYTIYAAKQSVKKKICTWTVRSVARHLFPLTFELARVKPNYVS